jgi:hypothetical protein
MENQELPTIVRKSSLYGHCTGHANAPERPNPLSGYCHCGGTCEGIHFHLAVSRTWSSGYMFSRLVWFSGIRC